MTAKTTICVPIYPVLLHLRPKCMWLYLSYVFDVGELFGSVRIHVRGPPSGPSHFLPLLLFHYLKKYRMLKLPHILQLQELKFYHKYINKKLPAYLQSIPLKQIKSFHEHLTRSHLKLHITRTNHRFAERCIRNSIPLLVNTMPMEIINKI